MGVRKQVSLLLAHGHPHALRYPVSMVFVEASIVASRIGVQMATQTSLLKMALSSIPNMNVKPAGTTRAAKELAELLKDMLDGE